jgi:hypothetical protein
MESDEMAEALRVSHCDRKRQNHKCQGVVTIAPGQLRLDCKLCGEDRHTLDETMVLVREAREICDIVGVNYDALDAQKRRELLLAVLDLAQNGL